MKATTAKKLLAGVLLVGITTSFRAFPHLASAMELTDPIEDITSEELLVAEDEAEKPIVPLDEMGIQTGRIYQDIYFKDEDGKEINVPCWVWIPKGATTDMPLTVFMHGSEQTSGKKNLPMENRHPKSALPLVIQDGIIPLDSMNTILISPHRSADTYGRAVYIDVIEAAMQYYSSDTGRIALTGFSWGGAMAYDLVAMRPDLFCAVFIASSGPRGNPRTVSILSSLAADELPPIVTMITKSDRDFPYNNVIEALKPLRGKVEIITVEGGHYDAAYQSYADPYVQELLFLAGDPAPALESAPEPTGTSYVW